MNFHDTSWMPSMSPQTTAISEGVGIAIKKRELMNKNWMKAIALLIRRHFAPSIASISQTLHWCIYLECCGLWGKYQKENFILRDDKTDIHHP